MTRMDANHDPHKMCKDHLLGNHNEAHQLVGFIKSGAINKLVGHAARGQIDLTRLDEWHTKIAEEMKRRGFDHDSPLDAPEFILIGEGAINQRTTNKLSERCEACDYE